MSDAFDQMKNINNYSTETNSEKEDFKYNKNEFRKPPFTIKDFVVKFGRKIVDFMTGLWFIVAGFIFLYMLGCFIFALFPDKYGAYPFINFAPTYLLCAIFIPLVVLIIAVVFNYLIYLLIDIRDSLKNIENK